MLSISNTFIINILNSIYNLDCICCKSIICPNNRKPFKTVLNILDEIKMNYSIVQSLYIISYKYDMIYIISYKYDMIYIYSYSIICEEIP